MSIASLIDAQNEFTAHLPAVVNAEAALASDAPLIHEHLKTNLFGAFSIAKGDVAAAMARAPHRLQRRFYHHRYAALPMECRGVAAIHDPRTDSITIWSATQVVHWVRREVAAILGLPEARVRCLALDVGGANIKAAHGSGSARTLPFELWKRPDELGRVLDALGRPLAGDDDRPLPAANWRPVYALPPHAMHRSLIERPLPLGLRAIWADRWRRYKRPPTSDDFY